MKPLIGVTAGNPAGRQPGGEPAGTGGCYLEADYVRAIAAAGGIPTVLPPQDPALAAEVLARVDGLLLAGGPDLDPLLFGEEPLPQMGRVDPERDAWELALARAALAADVPVLGVCRGMRVLAAGVGARFDAGPPEWSPAQSADTVFIEPGSQLSALLGERLPLQAFIDTADRTDTNVVSLAVPPPLYVVAHGPGGRHLAFESREHTFVVGLSTHPPDAVIRAVMARLVEAARILRTSGQGGTYDGC